MIGLVCVSECNQRVCPVAQMALSSFDPIIIYDTEKIKPRSRWLFSGNNKLLLPLSRPPNLVLANMPLFLTDVP